MVTLVKWRDVLFCWNIIFPLYHSAPDEYVSNVSRNREILDICRRVFQYNWFYFDYLHHAARIYFLLVTSFTFSDLNDVWLIRNLKGKFFYYHMLWCHQSYWTSCWRIVEDTNQFSELNQCNLLWIYICNIWFDESHCRLRFAEDKQFLYVQNLLLTIDTCLWSLLIIGKRYLVKVKLTLLTNSLMHSMLPLSQSIIIQRNANSSVQQTCSWLSMLQIDSVRLRSQWIACNTETRRDILDLASRIPTCITTFSFSNGMYIYTKPYKWKCIMQLKSVIDIAMYWCCDIYNAGSYQFYIIYVWLNEL